MNALLGGDHKYPMSIPLKSKTYIKEMYRFLPSSELNTRVARLAVLYEDLRIEMFAIAEPSIPILDYTDEKYRRLYFVRRAIATLVEFRGALMRINQCPEFSTIKSRFTPVELSQWQNSHKFFETNKEFFKKVRDDTGGHFQENAANYSLGNIVPSYPAMVDLVKEEEGAGIKLTFVGELVAVAITKHKENQSREEYFELLIGLIRQGFENALIPTHIIFNHYLLEKFS